MYKAIESKYSESYIEWHNFLFSYRKGIFSYYIGIILSFFCWLTFFAAPNFIKNDIGLIINSIGSFGIAFIFFQGYKEIYCSTWKKNEYRFKIKK